MTKDDVAAPLPIDSIAKPDKHLYQFPAGEDRERTHTATSTISSEIVGGMGSSCARRLSR
jgi:hypothetical protein